MPAPYVLPPDTRIVGSGNPPADEDANVDALNALATAIASITGTAGLSGFAGGGMSGAPTSGTYSTNQFVINQDGTVWVCTAGGSPGTWVQAPFSSSGYWLNIVAQYGADPTGATDSTTAIQAALTAASSGQVVYGPAGIYKTSAPLAIPQGVTLLGASGGFAVPIGNYGLGGLPVTGTVIKPSASFSGAAVILLNTGNAQGGQQQIRQISIDGSSLPNAVIHGIQGTNATAGVKIRDVLVYGGNGTLKGNGLDTRPGSYSIPDFWDVSHCKFSGCAGYGVSLNGLADSYFFAVESTGNTGAGWNITNSNNSRFTGCKAEGSGSSAGWLLTAASGFTGQLSFTGCTSGSSSLDGWQLNGPGAGIWTFTGCRSANDGLTSGAGITIQGSFAGTAQLTGVATVPASATPAYGLKISSVSGSARIQVANSTLWGVTGAVSNDGTAGSLLYDGNCIFTSGALGSPSSSPQPLALAQGGTGNTAGNAATATAAAGLESATTTVAVSGATAPANGQVLTATSGTAATWQNASSGFANPMTTAADLIAGGSGGSAQRLAVGSAGQVLTVVSGAPAWAAASGGGGQYLCTPTSYAPSTQVAIATLSGTFASLNAAATTVAAGSNGGEISLVASWSSPSAGVLDVASTAGWPTAGTITVAASGSTTAVVTYTGTTAVSLTGCAYVSGSATGTVATGGAVTLTAAGTGAVAVPNISTGSFTAPASGSVVVTASFVSQMNAAAIKYGLGLCAHGTLTPMVCNNLMPTSTNTTDPVPWTVQFLVTGLTPGNSYNFDLMFAVSGSPANTLTIFAIGYTATSPSFSAGNYGGPVMMTVQAV